MRVVLFGASGNAGRTIAGLLGPDLAAGDELVLAGRDAGRLAATEAALSSAADVVTASLDAADQARVRRLVEGADLVAVTVSRPDLVGDLARTVLDAGADWFDTLLSTPAKWEALRALEPAIARGGRWFVTDGGFHPGVPAALVRWAAGWLEEITEADVHAAMRIDWVTDTLSDSTVTEMLDEFTHFDMVTWVDGRHRRLRWSECPTVDFGPPIGRKALAPMPLPEMDALPTMYPTLRRCGFYIGGFSPVMDWVVLPVLMVLSRVRPLRPATVALTRWSMGRLASVPPPHRLVVRLDARGHEGGRAATASVSVSGSDGYLLTAAPAVSCIRGVLSGRTRAPGLHLQAHLVDPETLLSDLTAYGLGVDTRVDA